MSALAQEKIYTEDDYYNLPEDARAELIDGQIYYQAAPDRIHQKIINFLITEINIYIRSQNVTLHHSQSNYLKMIQQP